MTDDRNRRSEPVAALVKAAEDVIYAWGLYDPDDRAPQEFHRCIAKLREALRGVRA